MICVVMFVVHIPIQQVKLDHSWQRKQTKKKIKMVTDCGMFEYHSWNHIQTHSGLVLLVGSAITHIPMLYTSKHNSQPLSYKLHLEYVSVGNQARIPNTCLDGGYLFVYLYVVACGCQPDGCYA